LRIAPKQQNDNDQEEERPEDEGKQDEQKHILDEWAQLNVPDQYYHHHGRLIA
jgi:hypothetical protein